MLLSVSIGPVQGFVAQSRRTRDLWGSSYLLSYLAARAALGVVRAGGKIVRPNLEKDPLFQWVERQAQGSGGLERPPYVGSVPNHFVAWVDSVEAGRRAAQEGVGELERAWRHICQVVWDRYVAGADELGVDVAAIWRRQTERYWEVAWTVAPEGEADASLARRKLWRTHHLPDEPGDKCMVMPDFQELSGYVRARGPREREAQDRFWAEIRKKAGPLNLPPGDRLCAIALVKRLFASVSEEAIGGRIDVSKWPSTVYMAAVPWIDRVLESVPEQAAQYARAVANVAPREVFSERRPVRRTGGRTALGLGRALDTPHDTGGFERLDGNFFHADAVLNERLCVLPEEDPDRSAAIRRELAQRLKDIAQAKGADGKPLGSPSLFYALLLADGDRLGELLQVYKEGEVSEALRRFSARVPDIVDRHSGVVVYAGGDDVLAMLPSTTALDCARELAAAYRDSFGSEDPAHQAVPAGIEPTLSAAVLFTHARIPMNTSLGELRRLLDDVAKDENGRDSLAVGVLKRGGLHAQWVTTWRRPAFSDVSGHGVGQAPGGGASPEAFIDAVDAIQRLASHLDREAGGPLSTSLLYRLRNTLGLLCEWPVWAPGTWGRLLEGVDLPAFVRAEVRNSFEHRPAPSGSGREATGDSGGGDGVRVISSGTRNDENVEELVQAILDILPRSCRERREPHAGNGDEGSGGEGRRGLIIGVDGLLVAKFLANRGEEGTDE